MPDSFVPYAADPATVGRRQATVKRTETRDGVAAEFHRDEVLVADRRIRTFSGAGGSFRMVGSGATPQNLWTIENAVGSAVKVALRKLQVAMMQTASSATPSPVLSLYRIGTLPTGGTPAIKVPTDGTNAAQVSANAVVVRGGASADGTLSAITATAAGGRIATAFASFMLTSGTLMGEIDMLANVDDPRDLVLGANQAYLLQLTAAAAADNIAARHFLVDFAWDEFSEF